MPPTERADVCFDSILVEVYFLCRSVSVRKYGWLLVIAHIMKSSKRRLHLHLGGGINTFLDQRRTPTLANRARPSLFFDSEFIFSNSLPCWRCMFKCRLDDFISRKNVFMYGWELIIFDFQFPNDHLWAYLIVIVTFAENKAFDESWDSFQKQKKKRKLLRTLSRICLSEF